MEDPKVKQLIAALQLLEQTGGKVSLDWNYELLLEFDTEPSEEEQELLRSYKLYRRNPTNTGAWGHYTWSTPNQYVT